MTDNEVKEFLFEVELIENYAEKILKIREIINIGNIANDILATSHWLYFAKSNKYLLDLNTLFKVDEIEQIFKLYSNDEINNVINKYMKENKEYKLNYEYNLAENSK